MVKRGDALYVIFAFTFPAVVLSQELCMLLRIRARRPVAFTPKFHLTPTGRLETKPRVNSLICPALAPVTEVMPVAGSKLGFWMIRLLAKLNPVWTDINLLPLK